LKRAIVSVINDLSTDQRVHKVCSSLHSMGFDVELVGRRQRNSLELQPRLYRTTRMWLLFEKGVPFYAFFQIRLFFLLLSRKADVLVANDLDTLLPNYLASRLKRCHLVYDSHEIFCEVPELQSSPLKKRIWKSVERYIFPKLQFVFTVNRSIADLYSNEYKVPVRVLRNIPFFSVLPPATVKKQDLQLPADKKVIILQGAGINVDRGAEEAVQAMQHVDNAVLLIIGTGDVIGLLKDMTAELKLKDKVKFTGRIPFEELRKYTAVADLGLTLDKDTNVNYRYSLPNKLFDYIHAGVPVLASPLVEVKNIITSYNVGTCISSHDPREIAECINSVLSDESRLAEWKKNTKIAAAELNWQTEEQQLREVYARFI
jgi:glycosyltransferase involved in cell wall biosynthesis